MEDQDNSERTLPASIRRRAEARHQGQVAISGDLTAALMLIGTAMTLTSLGPSFVQACSAWLSQSFAVMPTIRAEHLTDSFESQRLLSLIQISVGLIASLWLMAVILRLMQTGLLFTPNVVQPRIERVNPSFGLQRIFSLSTLTHGPLWCLKLVVVGGFIGWSVNHDAASLAGLMHEPPTQLAGTLASLMISIAWRLGGGLLVVAAVDYGCRRWLLERRLRMTPDEVRAERRDAERSVALRQRHVPQVSGDTQVSPV